MEASGVAWSSLSRGALIPPLVKTPNAMQLFMFSAITWNRHLVHYSQEFAVSDGLSDIAPQRALLGAFLAQMLTDWVGVNGRIARLEWSVRGTAMIERPVTCSGRVVRKYLDGGRRLLDCRIGVNDHEGVQIVPGTAVVEFKI